MKKLAIILTLILSNRAVCKEVDMNEADEYILNAIKQHVWGGFDTPDEVQEMISDLLEGDENEKLLRESVNLEFNKKHESEKTWPKITDFDKLDKAFTILKENGVLCLHNAGYTMSDGHYDANEALESYSKGKFYGYCFYHGQDLERAADGGGLMLAYDHVDGDVPEKINVAKAIKKTLEIEGFVLEWDGTTNQRIKIPKINWQNRNN